VPNPAPSPSRRASLRASPCKAAMVAGVRFIGLVLDGPGSFTLMVLKAEVAMVVLTACAVLFERRRSQSLASNRQLEIPSPPRPPRG
jgi:hypothetical protein